MSFLPKLIQQATDVPNRYTPKKHVKLTPGDVVLIKENLLKRANFPLAIVEKTIENSLGEVTSVILRKGCNREIIERHVTSIIPLFQTDSSSDQPIDSTAKNIKNRTCETRPKRAAAIASANHFKKLAKAGEV